MGCFEYGKKGCQGQMMPIVTYYRNKKWYGKRIDWPREDASSFLTEPKEVLVFSVDMGAL